MQTLPGIHSCDHVTAGQCWQAAARLVVTKGQLASQGRAAGSRALVCALHTGHLGGGAACQLNRRRVQREQEMRWPQGTKPMSSPACSRHTQHCRHLPLLPPPSRTPAATTASIAAAADRPLPESEASLPASQLSDSDVPSGVQVPAPLLLEPRLAALDVHAMVEAGRAGLLHALAASSGAAGAPSASRAPAPAAALRRRAAASRASRSLSAGCW